MEHVRRIRLLAPLAAVVVVGAVGLVRPAALRAGDPPWDPPPCPPGTATGQAAGGAWYALDAELDAHGWLTGRRLSLGRLADAAARHIALPPESFASGPVGGRVLVGDDDGSRTRLRVVDIAADCATEIGREASVVRSAILAPDGSAAWEHRVNRATRADEGVWRRPLDGGPARRVLRGLAFEAAFGPTFSTELAFTADGRVTVASCGELACRLQILEPQTGRVDRIDGTGPLVGVSGDRAIAYMPCTGFPCPVEGIELRTGRRTTLLDDAGPAALGGPGGRTLVHQIDPGSLEAIDLETLRRSPVATGVLGAPVRGGSMATSGADIPDGWVLLAPAGHLTDPAAARRLDVATGGVGQLEEVQP
jgi:hypothetical protein